jgi:hypothetical protein
MKEALEKVEVRIDATVESILPGVHQRFEQINTSIGELQKEMKEEFKNNGDDIQIIAGAMDGMIRAQNQDRKSMATTCLQMAQRLLGEGKQVAVCNVAKGLGEGDGDDDGQKKRPAADASPQGKSEEPSSKRARATDSYLRLGLLPKYNLLLDLWEEWHGLGRFADDDLVGGFAKLEEELKSKWRKHLDSQHVSRIKRIVVGIKERMHSQCETFEEAMEHLETIFQEEACSISNMVSWMQRAGLLEKRAQRGGKKTVPNSD